MAITQGEGGGISLSGTAGSVCALTPSDQAQVVDNLIARIESLETAVMQLLTANIKANQLSDLSQQVGWVGNITYMGQPGWTQTEYGTLIPPAGMSLSSLGILMSDGNSYQAVVMDENGVLQFGFTTAGQVTGEFINGVGSLGYQPYAVQIGAEAVTWEISPGSARDRIELDNPGDCVAIPMILSAKMKFGGVGARMRGDGIFNVDWVWDVFYETSTGSLTKIASTIPSNAFMPSFQATISKVTDPYPTELGPGVYYLVLQNIGSYPIILVGQDEGSGASSGTIAQFFNLLRRGNYTPGADSISISTWTRYFQTAYAAMFGVMGNEDYPYGIGLPYIPPPANYGWP